ncbi:hypothetical protein GGR54DRAFT_632534 [Hypoxylon sp. NC1633]|nr:hypothetical protein GGR54DRAFT_632534 [Hypoxylon sp. NC1633]
MAPAKDEEARGEALPSYEYASDPSSSHAGQPGPSTVGHGHGPTVDSPFNFPSDTHLPSYAASDPVEHRPIAIPQIKAEPTSPLLEAYSQNLLRHGITEEAWVSFLHTLSGFLAATVSEKAVSHAAEVAHSISNVPKRFGKDTLEHVKATGHAISDSTKKGNYVGAATRVIGGAIALPVGTAIRAVGAVVSLPFATIGALTRDPKTPKERAVAYAAAANLKWLHARGLEAHLLDTAELGHALGLPVNELLRTAAAAAGAGAAGQIAALGAHLAEVQVRAPATLELGANTFWVVVTKKGEDPADTHARGKGRHH